MMIDKDKILSEIGGLLHGQIISNQTQFNDPRLPQGGVPGINIGVTNRLDAWQKQAVYYLSNNTDIYIVATPSAGKTLPIITYWAENIIGINPQLDAQSNLTNDTILKNLYNLFINNKTIPKIFIMVPVRTLAYEFMNNFTNILIELITKFVLLQVSISNQNIPINNQILNGIIINISKNNPYLLELWRNRERLASQIIIPNANPTLEQVNQLKIMTNEIEAELVKKLPDYIRDSFIHNKTGAGAVGATIEDAVFITSIYESAPKIIDQVVDKTPGLALLVIDEAHLTQKMIDDEQSRAPQIVENLYRVLKKIDKRTRIAFLSGTVNINSAKNLVKFLEGHLDRTFRIINDAPTSNPAKINVIPDNSITRDDVLISELISPRVSNTLIIIFSKKRIDKLIDIALSKTASRKTLSDIDKLGYISKPRFILGLKKDQPENLRQVTISQASEKEMLNRDKSSNIFDPKLREAVSAGFGWIYSIKDEKDLSSTEISRKQNDNQIIATLFRDGKIRTLLATDAIGIGVNINVQKLIIPSCEKFTGSKMEPLLVSDLSQLLNRAGRRSYKIASIHTPVEWVPKVVEALSAGPDNFEERVTIENMPTKGILIDWFKELWRQR